jgi:hypothetical protein
MRSFDVWTTELQDDACPACAVGRLLGPWPASPRFDQTPGLGPVSYRLEETPEQPEV